MRHTNCLTYCVVFRKHLWLNLKMTFLKRRAEQAGNDARHRFHPRFTIAYDTLGLYLSVLPQTAGNGIKHFFSFVLTFVTDKSLRHVKTAAGTHLPA